MQAADAPPIAERRTPVVRSRPARRRIRLPTALLLTAPLLLALIALYIVPFLGVAAWSVTLPTPGLGQYAKLATDPLVISVFLRTARICAIVTLLAVMGAYAITYVWVRSSRPMRRAIELCIFVPFWISLLTRAFGWLALLSSRGLVNAALQALGLTDAPIMLVRNEFGVVVGMVHVLIPFAVFPLASAMRAVDERVLLAAIGMGASRLRTFWTIFLPMTAPGIAGATLITFVFTLGFFVTPALLGGGRSVMVAELVYIRMFQSPNWGMGAAVSVALVLAVALLMAAGYRFARPALLGTQR